MEPSDIHSLFDCLKNYKKSLSVWKSDGEYMIQAVVHDKRTMSDDYIITLTTSQKHPEYYLFVYCCTEKRYIMEVKYEKLPKVREYVDLINTYDQYHTDIKVHIVMDGEVLASYEWIS